LPFFIGSWATLWMLRWNFAKDMISGNPTLSSLDLVDAPLDPILMH